MPILKKRLYNNILASKIAIDYNNLSNSCKIIQKQLDSNNNLHKFYNNQTILNMNSLYRDNTNDKI